MTTFALLSDIHTEFSQYHADFASDADYLLLAGDIGSCYKPERREAFMRRAIAFYGKDRVIAVDGNHEGYGGTWEGLKTGHTTYILPDDIYVLTTPLWSGEGSQLAYSMLNDSKKIGNFTWDKMNQAHINSVEYLTRELEKYQHEKTIVLTHHLPSRKCVDICYQNPASEIINKAFYTDLDYLIHEYQPNVWCFGHSHSSADFMLNKTRMISNPRGYQREGRRAENMRFDGSLTFVI